MTETETKHLKLICLIVGGALLMQSLDGTIVATALPEMAEAFGERPVDMSIVMVIYLLVGTIFIPISGWMADRFGARATFCTSIVVFTVASLLCGISQTLWELSAARALQGAGGALLLPVGRLILLRTAARSQYVAAISMLALLAQVGPLVGPPVGGFITTFSSWRFVFLINLPIGIVCLVLTAIYTSNYRPAVRTTFDWFGFLISAISLASIIYGMELLTHANASGSAAILLFLGVMAGATLYWLSRGRSGTVIDFSLLQIPTFRVNLTGGSIFRLGCSASPFLLPLLFQVGLGMSAFASGLVILVSALGVVGVRAFMAPIFRTFGFRRVFIVCGLITACLLSLIGFVTPGTPIWLVAALGLFLGLAQSLVYSGLNTIVYTEIRADRMSSATSLSQLSNQVTNTLAIAIGAVVLSVSAAWRSAAVLSLMDFRVAFLVTAFLVLSAIPFFVGLDPNAGNELSGARLSAT